MDISSVTDIKLNGDISVSNTGDIAIVSDIYNLQQRIINKLSTNQDYYLFGDFGSVTKSLIDSTGGNLINQLEQSVTAALLNEPAIASVDDITVTQDGDAFYVSISVTAVTDETISFKTQL